MRDFKKKARIVEQLRSGNSEIIKDTIHELKTIGWLYDGGLHSVDLSGIDLSEFDLVGVSLGLANLSGANLTGTNFENADLTLTDFSGANLDGAFLGDVDFSFTNLSNANLRATSLPGSFFLGTNLTNTDLSYCRVWDARFCDIDFSSAIGLDTIAHIRSSTIGIDTLVRSKGKIPEVFLRGCGVPEEIITISRLFGRIEYYTCFISYSHSNNDFARRLHNDLQALGIRCWKDSHDLPAGALVLDSIDRAIRERDITILLCSEAALASGWVDREMRIVFQEEERLYAESHKTTSKLIPVDLDGAIFDRVRFSSPMAEQIRQRNIVHAQDWQDYDSYEVAYKQIVAALSSSRGEM